MFQEFNLKIQDRMGSENVVVDHPSCIESQESDHVDEINEVFSNEMFF